MVFYVKQASALYIHQRMFPFFEREMFLFLPTKFLWGFRKKPLRVFARGQSF